MSLHFFISRAGEDREWAKWISNVLEGAGHTTTVQDFDFKPGQSIIHQMKLAEDRANHFIAVLSPTPLALLARGTPHDLEEAFRIATRSGMRLYLADYHLAKGNLAEAERLIDEAGYHRRDPELAALRAKLAG
jgi:hypothetical protein